MRYRAWRMTAFLPCALACALSCALSCAAAGAAPVGRPLVGISMNVPEGGTAQDIVREIGAARRQGAAFAHVSKAWSDIEPSKGRLDVRGLAGDLRYLAAQGYEIGLVIKVIDTNNRVLPADLQAQPFGSPEIRARLDTMLAALAPSLPKTVKWVFIGNEVDVYLRAHAGETAPYSELVRAGRDRLRKAVPGIAVGTVTTYDGLVGAPEVVAQVNRASDVYGVTYYPLRPDFKVRPVSDVAPDFARMASFAGKRPICMLEAGCPASPELGSSEDRQAAFVDAVFDALGRHKSQFAALNFFLLCDFSRDQVRMFLQYYGSSASPFRAYLSTLGLKQSNGAPRKAWRRYDARIRAWSAGR